MKNLLKKKKKLKFIKRDKTLLYNDCWMLSCTKPSLGAGSSLDHSLKWSTPESKQNQNLYYCVQQHFKITYQTVWIILDSFCAFLSSTYKASTKTFALLTHAEKKTMKNQEVLHFYGKRDCVGILGCPDMGRSNIFAVASKCIESPRSPSSAYLSLTIEDLASYL